MLKDKIQRYLQAKELPVVGGNVKQPQEARFGQTPLFSSKLADYV